MAQISAAAQSEMGRIALMYVFIFLENQTSLVTKGFLEEKQSLPGDPEREPNNLQAKRGEVRREVTHCMLCETPVYDSRFSHHFVHGQKQDVHFLGLPFVPGEGIPQVSEAVCCHAAAHEHCAALTRHEAKHRGSVP